jgi:hypothetical protein
MPLAPRSVSARVVRPVECARGRLSLVRSLGGVGSGGCSARVDCIRSRLAARGGHGSDAGDHLRRRRAFGRGSGARFSGHVAERRRGEVPRRGNADGRVVRGCFPDRSADASTRVCGARTAARFRAAVDDRSRRVARRGALRCAFGSGGACLPCCWPRPMRRSARPW